MNNEFFSFETGAATDQGCVRDHNEDSHLERPECGIWVVADGMGGHAAGDFASQTITEELGSVGMPGSAGDLQARFMERLRRAHMRIIEHAEMLGGGTVGATLVGLLAFEDAFACIWSGDSRIYLLRGGLLTQQTQDHTEVRELLASGAITEQQAAEWPRKNVITRAIGVSPEPNCDVVSGQLEAGDSFLLCSDGLTEHLEDHELAEMMRAPSAQAACDAMIAETLARGARDNVTAVVLRCHPPMMGG
jgi:serine/threonine protein phosphatase PrpC